MPKQNSDSNSTAVAKSLFVRCRYCGQKNTVRQDYKNNSANCGRCKMPLSNDPHKKFADSRWNIRAEKKRLTFARRFSRKC